jgi:general secretion pathway protein K
MRSKSENTRSESGAALVTVLVMLSIMAALAIVVVEAARFSMLRTSNQHEMDQNRWYLIGAEAYAAAKIASLRRAPDAARIDQDVWQERDFTYPLDDGVMTIRLRDGSNCFNLNSLVERDADDALVASARGQVQFARLLDLLDVRADRSPAASLADWIDSDEQASPSGAEDAAYVGPEAGYRTANTFIGDISELSRVRGFDDEILRKIEPFACVRPSETPNQLNVNTLLPRQAPLLSAMIGPDLPLADAREVIRSRPRGGWADLDAFLAHPRLAGLEITEVTRAQFATESRYYVVAVRVRRGDTGESSMALIDAGGGTRILRRVLGAASAESLL